MFVNSSPWLHLCYLKKLQRLERPYVIPHSSEQEFRKRLQWKNQKYDSEVWCHHSTVRYCMQIVVWDLEYRRGQAAHLSNVLVTSRLLEPQPMTRLIVHVLRFTCPFQDNSPIMRRSCVLHDLQPYRKTSLRHIEWFCRSIDEWTEVFRFNEVRHLLV